MPIRIGRTWTNPTGIDRVRSYRSGRCPLQADVMLGDIGVTACQAFNNEEDWKDVRG